jgi:hypothetical protein
VAIPLGRSHRRRSRVATHSVAIAPANDRQILALLEAERNTVALLEERLAEASPLLQESVTDLEQRLLDPGWRRFVALTEQEFTPEGMQQLRAVCRLSSLVNPLLKRGLSLRSAYVWGQAVEITARANGRGAEGEQDVQAVVSGFLNDPGNLRAVTGTEARDQLERSGLGCEGNVFIACFTRPQTGEVQVRTILADEIAEIICNPEDRSEPWFYRRIWDENQLDMRTGRTVPVQRERFYPALDYRPNSRPRRIGGVDVAWDAPILHVSVNRPLGWQFGVPDSYAAVNWARAYKEFLEQWATLMKSLARFAWRLTAKGSQRTQAKTKLATAPSRDPVTGAAQDVGATALIPPEQILEAIPKSGATIDAESGRPLAMMVAAALDVPVTMLLSDPGQTGARATAETLDQPTELAMQQRRDLWAGAYRRLLQYVIAESVRAPQGALKGKVVRDRYGRQTVVLAGDTDDTIDIDWPDLDDRDPATIVKSIVDASAVGVIPPEVVLRLLLTALGVRDVDGIIQGLLGDDGEFKWPQAPPLGPGQKAADAQRTGQDPAALGAGPMAPGEEPADETGAGRLEPVAARQAGLDWGLAGGTVAGEGEAEPPAEAETAEPVAASPGVGSGQQPAIPGLNPVEQDPDGEDEDDLEDTDLGRFRLS